MTGYAHKFRLQRRDPNDDGGTDDGAKLTTSGLIAFASARDQQIAAQAGVIVEAVARVPKALKAREQDRILCDIDPRIDPNLQGTWEITAIHPNAIDHRLMLRKVVV